MAAKAHSMPKDSSWGGSWTAKRGVHSALAGYTLAWVLQPVTENAIAPDTQWMHVTSAARRGCVQPDSAEL